MQVRRMISCVLMMTLLLAGCGKSGDDSPEELAARIRAEYLSLSGWTAQAELCADYGEQVFEFAVDAAWERGGDTVITVTQPELIAGITARIREGETYLEYDGAGLSLGMLDPDGTTPVSALPALIDCVTGGYMARCVWTGEGDERELAVLCHDPGSTSKEGVAYSLYFDPSAHTLKRAEVSVDGVLRLRVQFTEFTMEMNENESGTDEDMGGGRSAQSGA